MLSIIARVRRAMPRNMDVMAICEVAEKAGICPAVLPPSECPECARRREANAQRVRKFREKQK